MREIHNLQEVIEECLDDIPIDDPEFSEKYSQNLQKGGRDSEFL